MGDDLGVSAGGHVPGDCLGAFTFAMLGSDFLINGMTFVLGVEFFKKFNEIDGKGWDAF